jgi:aspartyl-tRNA(Asn)/glutamyl-tRNA(Gln) amidotransferase subunit A
VRSRAEAGFAVSAVEYLEALQLRAKVTREFIAAVFAEADVLITPTIAEPAPSYETAKGGSVAEVIARMSVFTRFTRVFNTVGLPALSLPCGFTAAGLPVALQIVGRPFDEATVLRAADAYQRLTDWHTRRPVLA